MPGVPEDDSWLAAQAGWLALTTEQRDAILRRLAEKEGTMLTDSDPLAALHTQWMQLSSPQRVAIFATITARLASSFVATVRDAVAEHADTDKAQAICDSLIDLFDEVQRCSA